MVSTEGRVYMPSNRYTDEELNTEMIHSASFLRSNLQLGGEGLRVTNHLPCGDIGRLVAFARLRYGADVVNAAISEHQKRTDAVEEGGCPVCNARLVSEKTVLCEEHQAIVDAPREDITDKLG